jgi:hypothetical protein
MRRARNDAVRLAAMIALAKARSERSPAPKAASAPATKTPSRKTAKAKSTPGSSNKSRRTSIGGDEQDDEDEQVDESNDDDSDAKVSKRKKPGAGARTGPKSKPRASSTSKSVSKRSKRAASDASDSDEEDDGDESESDLPEWVVSDTFTMPNQKLPIRKVVPVDKDKADSGWLAKDLAALVNVKQYWLSTRWYSKEERYAAYNASQ